MTTTASPFGWRPLSALLGTFALLGLACNNLTTVDAPDILQPGQLNTPHSIATDAQGNVYVANRGNSRIEVFDGDGKYLRQIKISEPFDYANTVPLIGNKPPVDLVGTMGPGAPWTVCITPGPNQVLYASDAFPGRVYKISLDGKVLGKLGGTGRQLKEFGWIHEIACPSENEIYVGELINWRMQKLMLHPAK